MESGSLRFVLMCREHVGSTRMKSVSPTRHVAWRLNEAVGKSLKKLVVEVIARRRL